MQERYTLSSFRVLKVECNMVAFDDIARDPKREGVLLKIGDRLRARKAKNSDNKIMQLEIITTITSDEVEDLKIELLSQTIFTFLESVEDTEEVMQNECYPLAQKKVYEAIKEITTAMGVPPIDLNKQMEKG